MPRSVQETGLGGLPLPPPQTSGGLCDGELSCVMAALCLCSNAIASQRGSLPMLGLSPGSHPLIADLGTSSCLTLTSVELVLQ